MPFPNFKERNFKLPLSIENGKKITLRGEEFFLVKKHPEIGDYFCILDLMDVEDIFKFSNFRFLNYIKQVLKVVDLDITGKFVYADYISIRGESYRFKVAIDNLIIVKK